MWLVELAEQLALEQHRPPSPPDETDDVVFPGTLHATTGEGLNMVVGPDEPGLEPASPQHPEAAPDQTSLADVLDEPPPLVDGASLPAFDLDGFDWAQQETSQPIAYVTDAWPPPQPWWREATRSRPQPRTPCSFSQRAAASRLPTEPAHPSQKNK